MNRQERTQWNLDALRQELVRIREFYDGGSVPASIIKDIRDIEISISWELRTLGEEPPKSE